MTQKEFEDRVQMQVSASEYQSIENVYMTSDLGKDEFCKVWVKMNASRVAAAKAEARKQAAEAERKDKAYRLFDRITSMKSRFASDAEDQLSDSQKDFLKSLGIEMRSQKWYQPYSTAKALMEVHYELGQYLRIF